ncbi:hypothetical protein IOC61_03030 [Halomonas sp. KAO]|uniref:hypothetical protein n=1 Tax=Halomonas sp. KAO TaxID=2783858 RepID=UPI00189C5F83|nr:hypothetical protein [Halomonas sp. KAO]MBF7052289.1 hypothetical protein [Halomonas sp. KAO]
MALKSLLTQATSVGRQAAQKARHGGGQDGWSDGWHTQASTTESLRMLRDSATDVVRSTAKAATTQEGWRRIARGTGKVAGGAAVVAGGMAQGIVSTGSEAEGSHINAPWNANASDPRTNRSIGLYFDHTGAPIDCLGNPLYED